MRDADADLFRKCVVSVSAGRAAAGCVWAQADGDGPETTEIGIYGGTSAVAPAAAATRTGMSKQGGPLLLSMRVVRITSAPRVPRPDDPTPRQPPAHSLLSITLSDLGVNKCIVPGKDDLKCKETQDQVLGRVGQVCTYLGPRGGNRTRVHVSVRVAEVVVEAHVKMYVLTSDGDASQGIYEYSNER
ncbi:hypothetical protein JVU11DRAFT_1912 [Chiua virens]|nr:hypothetical protein JVU11DRAFT_1912 [Chiua virens]